MERLQQFTQLLCGSFDNAAQFRQMQAKGEASFPFARHVNTPCNEKIRGLPQGFDGVFVVEESYYTVNGRTHASPHLFLFTQQGENIKLTSYDLPQGCGKAGFTFETMGEVAFGDLSPSKKFTPRRVHLPRRRVGGRQHQHVHSGAEIYAVRALFKRRAGGV